MTLGMQNQNACQGDAQRLCNQFIPDRSKVASCLLFKNKRQLAPACRTVISGGSGKATSRKGAWKASRPAPSPPSLSRSAFGPGCHHDRPRPAAWPVLILASPE